MEVQLDKRYPVQASLQQAWAVLSDIPAVARCMPGAQITEQRDATHYNGTVKAKVGPAVMQFAGEIEVLALDAAGLSMQMLGKGADKTGSAASMNLKAHLEAGDSPGTSVLVGKATVVVSGKLAQLGSRLLVPVSDALLAQFAAHFNAAAVAAPAGPAAGSPAEEGLAAGAIPEAEAARAAAHSPALPAAVRPAAQGAEATPIGAQGPLPVPTTPLLPATPAPTLPATRTVPPPQVQSLSVLGLLWAVLKSALARLRGRRA